MIHTDDSRMEKRQALITAFMRTRYSENGV